MEASVAARVTKPAPATPADPFEVSMRTSISVICSRRPRWMLVACAMKERAHAEVDCGAVGVEGVAGGHHHSDHRLGAAQLLELQHHRRQDGFGRRGAGGDEQFVAKIGEQAERLNPAIRAMAPSTTATKRAATIQTSAVKRDERAQTGHAILADGVGHGAECGERSKVHEDAHDAEHPLSMRSSRSTRGFAVERIGVSARPKRTPSRMICRMLPVTKGSPTLDGSMPRRKATNPTCCALAV
jgi:hypothetical protein